MNYAQHLQNVYYDNKDKINKHRKEIGLSYVLTLEDKLNDGYKAYKAFCYDTGVTPKKIGEFLRSKVI
jgi:hypothetical protein